MTASELTARVTLTIALAVLPLALGGLWLAGVSGAAGVVAGGALALFSFRLLAARAVAAAPGTAWLLASGLRFAAVTAVAALLFARGWGHPLGVLAGYSALPVAVLALGLWSTRENAPWK